MQHTDTILQNTPIIDVDMTNFVAEVIEKSMEVPVVVDFWAPWCEPCKILMPILEKIVREKSGAVIIL
jgi:putative thioredoxin